VEIMRRRPSTEVNGRSLERNVRWSARCTDRVGRLHALALLEGLDDGHPATPTRIAAYEAQRKGGSLSTTAYAVNSLRSKGILADQRRKSRSGKRDLHCRT